MQVCQDLRADLRWVESTNNLQRDRTLERIERLVSLARRTNATLSQFQFAALADIPPVEHRFRDDDDKFGQKSVFYDTCLECQIGCPG